MGSFGGRPLGSKNKLSGDIKTMIVEALEAVGGTDYLVFQARKNPVAFMGLVGKLLPTQLTVKDGGALNAFDPTTLTDEELSARIARLRRPAIIDGTAEAADVSEQPAGMV